MAKLYVVGTPIGNLEDFSPRAIRILGEVDFIAAEDTRVTQKLLNHFRIKKETVSYFEHNKNEKGKIITDRILNGQNCALVTDAGMPAISDPGEDLVLECQALGIEIESVPGPTAFATALSLSGMPSRRFCFEGFLSVNKKERKEHLDSIKDEERTLIFYEAPHKLLNTLKDLYEALGSREAAIIKEITKIHETVLKINLSEAVPFFTENPPKGEYVIIIKGKQKEKEIYTIEQAVKIARQHIKAGESTSNAAKLSAKQTGIKKGDIYGFLMKN